jgi:hypothetical protein
MGLEEVCEEPVPLALEEGRGGILTFEAVLQKKIEGRFHVHRPQCRARSENGK